MAAKITDDVARTLSRREIYSAVFAAKPGIGLAVGLPMAFTTNAIIVLATKIEMDFAIQDAAIDIVQSW